MAFLKDLFGGKKIETKTFKETDNIRQFCPAQFQGILMNHSETVRDIVKTIMESEEYGYSKDEISVNVKFFGKNNRIFYYLTLGRRVEVPVTNNVYSNTVEYRVNNKYDVTLSLNIYVKNRNKDGVDRAKAFYDIVRRQFTHKCNIR